MVPNGWEVRPISELCESIIDCVNKTAKHVDYETPYKMIRTTNVRNGKVDTENVRYVEKDTYEIWIRRGAPRKGDIIFTREAPVGEVGILEDAEGIFLGQRTMMYRVDPKVANNRFVFYSLTSRYGQKQFLDLSNGGTVHHMRVPDCGKILIKTPPLPEQQKIAKILTAWDKAINTTERLIDNSTQQKKALMQQLLTGKKRLLDENGERFEGEWEKVKLADIANISMGSSPKSAAYNDEGIGLPLLQGNADIKNRKSAPRIYTSQITRECQIGDILLSVRAPVGTVALSEHHACIGRGISSIRAKKKHSQDFLYQLMLDFEPRWRAFSQGSTFEAVNSNDIKSLSLNVPNFEEQQKIAAVLTNTNKEIELLEQQLADLQQEKKALMQQLLTGKKRVVVDGEIA